MYYNNNIKIVSALPRYTFIHITVLKPDEGSRLYENTNNNNNNNTITRTGCSARAFDRISYILHIILIIARKYFSHGRCASLSQSEINKSRSRVCVCVCVTHYTNIHAYMTCVVPVVENLSTIRRGGKIIFTVNLNNNAFVFFFDSTMHDFLFRHVTK